VGFYEYKWMIISLSTLPQMDHHLSRRTVSGNYSADSICVLKKPVQQSVGNFINMKTVNFPDEEDVKRWVKDVIREEFGAAIKEMRNGHPPEEEALLTRKEIAAYLGVSLVTLTSYVKRGMPSHSMRKKGAVRFWKSEVLKWMKDKKGPR
jgi:excisionase family DNA binding protein